MTALRLVSSRPTAEQPCSCRTWGLLRPISRDLILFDFMRWALIYHQVRIKMLARDNHVAICELLSIHRGGGRARRVMTEICAWADCARVTLELSPSDEWGANLERLTRFYMSMGFQQNDEVRKPLLIKESMIRYPVRGRGHVRL